MSEKASTPVGFKQAMESDVVEPIQRSLYELIEVMVSANHVRTSLLVAASLQEHSRVPLSTMIKRPNPHSLR